MTIALEKFTNNVANTLNGAINSSVTSITVTDASSMPSTGNFRIIIDSELMLVTAVSSNTLTVTRGIEGTTGASHLDLAPVTLIVTVAALQAGIGDFFLNALFSDRPAAGLRGRIFTPTDWEGVGYYDDGTAWNIILPDGKIIPEMSSDGLSTSVNMTGATYAAVQGFLRIADTTTGNLRIRYKSTSAATSLQVTMAVRMNSGQKDQCLFGPYFGQSSNDHGYLTGYDMDIQNNSNFDTFLAYFSSLSAFGGADYTQVMNRDRTSMLWMRGKFTFSSGKYEFFTSNDGTTWIKEAEATNSNASAPDRVGFTWDRFGSIFTPTVNFDIYHLDIVEV